MNAGLWGPKTIRNNNGKAYKIYVMTMVNLVTGWFELTKLKDKPNTFICMERFNSVWLVRYPHLRENEFNN